ncbi:hypothetical protein [Candidatus Chloroploca sp. Khr17]|uniref:hypothetical protein n=1 Tax=Candidatus Chloroploca sp. Khr17 TaxID=2496869 RepID=UPI00196BB23A|nr:hypothetical protein [Candidatus Chloroploca sp. Khr17]
MLRHRRPDRLGDGRAAGEQIIREAQHLTQHKAHPGRVDGRVRAQALLVILPLLQRAAHASADLGVVRVQALGEDAQQHRHAQERA